MEAEADMGCLPLSLISSLALFPYLFVCIAFYVFVGTLICFYVWAVACHSMCVAIRGQLCGMTLSIYPKSLGD